MSSKEVNDILKVNNGKVVNLEPKITATAAINIVDNNNNNSSDEANDRIRSISPIDLKRLNKLLKLSNPNLKKSPTIEELAINESKSFFTGADSNVNGDAGGAKTTAELLDETDEIDHNQLLTVLTPTACPNLGVENNAKRVHRVVLTGGPCAGKTTSINRIKVFFENIGWKAFVVPETATLLLTTGIYFYELGSHTLDFQENLLKTLLQIEDSINQTVKFYHETKNQNCIVIYDRGAMDPVAYLSNDDWEILKQRNPTWNEVDLRDNRYDQIIHLVTAAKGAEKFYILDNNVTRTEGIELARQLDRKTAKAWIGHPYIDVIDNRTDFEMKIARVLQAVCLRIGLQLKGFDIGNRKRKFLVKSIPDADAFPTYQDFNVVHNYLVSNSNKIQARIRKRGQSNVWSYTYTVRVLSDNDQTIETYKQIDKKEHAMLLKSADTNHYAIYKLRRCFEWNHRYFQLDMYEEPCNPRCRGLVILTTRCIDQDLCLPDFLEIEKEVTDDPQYSMHNLSLKKV